VSTVSAAIHACARTRPVTSTSSVRVSDVKTRRLLADQGLELTVWAGIASYPAHALEAREVLLRAQAALRLAREWSQSRIEVALPE
jgi:GGDEF domain-containing protein